jgi:hypothetical protein
MVDDMDLHDAQLTFCSVEIQRFDDPGWMLPEQMEGE